MSTTNEICSRFVVECEYFLNEAIGFAWLERAMTANMLYELGGGYRIRHNADFATWHLLRQENCPIMGIIGG